MQEKEPDWISNIISLRFYYFNKKFLYHTKNKIFVIIFICKIINSIIYIGELKEIINFDIIKTCRYLYMYFSMFYQNNSRFLIIFYIL